MRKRIAVWKDLKSSAMPLVDAVLPQYKREIFNVIGRGVTEDATMAVAIPDAQDFHMAIIKAQPGKGTGLHTHKTIEVFLVLSGTWSVQWGDDGENELTLGQWDVISIPTEIMRGFRNDGSEEAVLLSILGGTNPGKVGWNDSVLDAVKARGYALDEDGNIAKIGG
jgi:mannose-6-phosphate isomerase-like protein (cupin superfamily)